jgi:signal transduction histidine kinase
VLINPKLFRTSTFRLAAVYLAVFALSVGAILAYLYWSTVRLIESQTDETIRAEVLGLADQYRVQGLEGVADVVRRRSRSDTDTLYVLVDPRGTYISGNLKGMPPDMEDKPGWVDFPIVRNRNGVVVNHTARGFHSDLEGDYEVLVGRDVQELRQFSDLIRRTLFVSLGLAMLLGVGGGLLTSRNFLRRIDAITGTSRNIMEGDLTHRMPVKGTNDELDRLSVSLNEMLDQIERLMSGMKDVTSNIAHDLKTPLTRMRARVEAALRSGQPDEYRAALNQSLEESDSLLRTFNALLSIARAESGNAREGLEQLNLADTLNDVTELYEPIIEEAGGTLKHDIAPDLHMKGDRQLLSQAVSNLIDNAIKYGAENAAEISVSATRSGDTIEVVVADNGAGIPAAERERVKERFTRLDASRTKPGNGLGLPLVASIMHLHGGGLVLEDNKPGLRARLILPIRS